MADRRIELLLDDASKDWLTTHGYEPRYGARPLNRLIKRCVLNPLSIMMLKGEVKNGDVVRVSVENEELVIKPDDRKLSEKDIENREKD